MEIESLGEEEGLEEFKKPTKTLLLDADTIAYATGSTCEYADDLLAREMYSDEEWESIINDKQYDSVDGCVWKMDIDRAVELSIERIEEIKEATFTKDVLLYFTETKKNFRYVVHPMYKANRKSTRYPPEIRTIKERLLEKYKGEICEEIEADDAVVYLKRTNPEKYVLAACDKDVYRSVPGKHFNYYRSVMHNKDMKWITTTKEEAEEFPYIQCLTGDSTDNIMGCPGIGPKRAIKILTGCRTPHERWEAVVKTFESKGLTVKDAIRDMRLVHMNQVKLEDGKWVWTPWTPPTI